MVMYQMAYTPWVFFFFVPMVFIGAFFLLNLTLAVINSSYSEAQDRIKREKEKIKRDQEMLANAALKDNNGDDLDQIGGNGEANLNLGIREFILAKIAARKLKAFCEQHKRDQEKLKRKAKRKEREEKKKEDMENKEKQ